MEELKNYSYLLTLLYCALMDKQPPAPPKDVDLAVVYEIAELHDVRNTAYYAIEKLNTDADPALLKKWADMRNKCFHRNLIQTAEYNNICAVFEENGIKYMPLKGLKVSELYPTPDFRYMSDLDFLVGADLKKADKAVMSLGYTLEETGKGHHDKLSKPPFMVIELHHELVGLSSEFYGYYTNAFERANKVNEFRYEMTPEDFYIYVFVHLYKHYSKSGTGIRSASDVYLINKKLLPKLNKEYIDGELKKLGLDEFTAMISEIAEKWFGKADFAEFSEQELYILGSGTYGNHSNFVRNRMNAADKGTFWLRRLFPPVNKMKDDYLILRKLPFLLPFMYIHRFFRGAFVKNKQIREEIIIVKNSKKELSD